MKKKLRPLLGAAAFTTLVISMTMNAFAGQVTEKSAMSRALKDADVKENELLSSSIELEREDGTAIYEVEFYTEDFIEYQYEILAEDGTVLKIDYDGADAFRAGKKTGNAVTLEQAKRKAAEDAGFKLDEVTFEKAETGEEDLRTIHELEFFTDTAEYDYEIDAATGYILKWEYQLSEKGKQSQEKGLLSLEDAKKAALKRAGRKSSEVTWGEVESDYDDGRLVYEGEFYSGGLEYEFEIDAATGAFLDWDIDD